MTMFWFSVSSSGTRGFLGGSADKESACNVGDLSLIPGLGRSHGEGNDYPFQYSALKNSMGRKELDTTEQYLLLSGTHLPSFSPFQFASSAEGYRMVSAEFFDNFSCSYKRISFDDPLSWSLSASNGQPLHSSSSRLLSPLQTSWTTTPLVEAAPGPNKLLMLQFVFTALRPILNSNTKIAQICFFSNIISLV